VRATPIRRPRPVQIARQQRLAQQATVAPQTPGWHATQQAVGNQAIQRLLSMRSTLPPAALTRAVIQRALSTEERAKNLKAARFAGDERLEKAFDNSPPMRRGEKGDAVAKLQQALIDDGFKMPVSTRKTGSPDGIYGRETKDTVIKFQGTYGLKVDGAVGRQTLGKLDELYAGPTPTKISPKTKPEIEASESELGKHIVDDMDKANDPKSFSPTSGIWYSHNYEAMHEKDPVHYPWNDDYRSGYANPAYFVRIGFMDWLLRPMTSASAGIKAWLAGLTIAECNSALVAIQINALRAAIGDSKFDELYGSADKPVPSQQRLRIKQGTKGTPLEKYIKWVDLTAEGGVGTKGNRPVKVGGWYYFYNHPKYLLKHPDGAFQGENAIYAGKNKAGEQLWSGLGVSNVTEDRMLAEMASAYNQGRSRGDYRVLVTHYAPDAPELKQPKPDYRALYFKYLNRIEDKYRHDKGQYPDKVSVDDILNDPPYELNGTVRKGGFVGQAKLLDVAKIKQTRES